MTARRQPATTRSAADILREHGISTAAAKFEQSRQLCPRCSAQRSKATDPCLSVLVDREGVRWRCWHCGWTGGRFYGGAGNQVEPVKQIPANPDDARKRNKQTAARLWREAVPLRGTLGEKYLRETRGLDVVTLNLDHALRWHHGDHMLVALFTDPISAKPRAIHRRYISREAKPFGKWKSLGGSGVTRLWPDDAVEEGLVIGEGIETVLAAALAVAHRGTLLRPAWATGCAASTARFPVLPGVEALTILADNDANNAGQKAAHDCATRWRDAGREVILLTPPVKDFNELIKEPAR
jgi:hypothetical protein